MEESALKIADLWNIGIGISGVLTTLIAVGVAIAIPAWQRKKELEAAKSERTTYHIAILTWLRNDLEKLWHEVREKMRGDNEYLGELSFHFDNLDHFLLSLPENIAEVRSSPALLTTCPPILIKLLWNLNELEIDVASMKKNTPQEECTETYKELREIFCVLHYDQILKDLDDLYELSFDLGLEVRKTRVSGNQVAIEGPTNR